MVRLGDERREVVRRGYDRVGADYLAWRPVDGADVRLLGELHTRLPPAALVLDVGCGAGVPVASVLLARGHRVIGLDLSLAQLALAGVHSADLVTVGAEMSALPVASGSMDGLVSYYAVIHVPRDDHRLVFAEFRRVLRRGAWALVCLGSSDIPDDLDEGSWLGTPMYWSHYDADTSVALISAAGFVIAHSWDVADPMGHGGHRFVLAQAA